MKTLTRWKIEGHQNLATICQSSAETEKNVDQPILSLQRLSTSQTLAFAKGIKLTTCWKREEKKEKEKGTMQIPDCGSNPYGTQTLQDSNL